MTLRTALTQALQVRYPVVLAAMDVTTEAGLARAVTEAGGMGFVGAGYGGEAWLSGELASIASWARRSRRPFGVGFASWSLHVQPALLDLALRHGPKAVWLSFGAPDLWIERIQAAGALAVCQVHTEAMAGAALSAGADILVAQYPESNDDAARPGSLALLAAVTNLAGHRVPVIASADFASGPGLAAALMLGASGVVLQASFHGKLVSGVVDQDLAGTSLSSSSLRATRRILGNLSPASDHLKRWLEREIEQLRASPAQDAPHPGRRTPVGVEISDHHVDTRPGDLAARMAVLVDEAEQTLRGAQRYLSHP